MAMLFPGSEMGLVPARASPFERPRPSGEQAERLARPYSEALAEAGSEAPMEPWSEAA